MEQTLGLAKLRCTVWQQDWAKPHQATLGQDGDEMARHQDRMHAIKWLRGDTLAPYSSECNPFLSLGYMKEKVYQPLPGNIAALKRKVRS